MGITIPEAFLLRRTDRIAPHEDRAPRPHVIEGRVQVDHGKQAYMLLLGPERKVGI
jgi:hypothetical protein